MQTSRGLLKIYICLEEKKCTQIPESSCAARLLLQKWKAGSTKMRKRDVFCATARWRRGLEDSLMIRLHDKFIALGWWLWVSQVVDAFSRYTTRLRGVSSSCFLFMGTNRTRDNSPPRITRLFRPWEMQKKKKKRFCNRATIFQVQSGVDPWKVDFCLREKIFYRVIKRLLY